MWRRRRSRRRPTELGAVGVLTDVSDSRSVQSLADAVRDRFGTVHVLCNNAGVGGGGLIADQTLADWQWVLGVNLWGVVHGLHSFMPMLVENPDGGHVVNTASVAGLVAGAGIGPVQREQVRGRRDQRDAAQGARARGIEGRGIGPVPWLRADEHLREPAEPARVASKRVAGAAATPASRTSV